MFEFNEKISLAAGAAMERIRPKFAEIEKIEDKTQGRVLQAFISNCVQSSHFAETTGYGYGDVGRENLDALCADIYGGEDALIRHSFACGTATIAAGLHGILRPGDTLLVVSGTPYDTLHPVLGLRKSAGSLADFGVKYAQTELTSQGDFDYPAIKAALARYSPKVVYLQRSRGYTLRAAITIAQIEKLADFVHKNSSAAVFADNCYGEFTEELEPCHVGADIVAGSLIKNAGGGVARCGGYLAGRRDLIELCAVRMSCAGLGRKVGASLGNNRELFLSLFHAPHVTAQALKSAVFAATLFEDLGYEVLPRPEEKRSDIVQAIKLGGREKLIAFCQAIQSASPVDSLYAPVPGPMPGYDSEIIMATGAFTSGSSIELSADAPLREPYAVWLQGGLNFVSAKLAVTHAAQAVGENIA
ncbi:MAG: methionine gamma-lyase family protein, partial [Oscillospiraceae bacterium]|nr:methionine gamma-lyase family protein [Oscillospiraceae bacterium]